MDLEGITLSEISQTEKERQIPYDLTYMWNLKKVELTETEMTNTITEMKTTLEGINRDRKSTRLNSSH